MVELKNMKIIGICGSPRKGNSEFMLRTILESAKSEGTETELILLREKNITLADGSGRRIQNNDDIEEIYSKMKDADIIVFSSPVWYDMITPQMLNFIDRIHPYHDESMKGKKFAFILAGELTGEEAEESQGRAIDYLKQISKLWQMELVNFISAKGVEEVNDAEKREDIIEKCEELTKRFLD